MPILLKGECCVCTHPLGYSGCQLPVTGIAEAYFTCPSQINSIIYGADSNGCDDEAEILSFGLDLSAPVELNELLQPIKFVQQDDDSGALHEYEETEDTGNVTLNHTFTFQVRNKTVDDQAIINTMLGREIAILIKYKSDQWYLINHKGGMRATSNAGNSNTSYTTVTVSGRVNERPKFVSLSDDGAWADANLIPYDAIGSPNGLINDPI